MYIIHHSIKLEKKMEQKRFCTLFFYHSLSTSRSGEVEISWRQWSLSLWHFGSTVFCFQYHPSSLLIAVAVLTLEHQFCFFFTFLLLHWSAHPLPTPSHILSTLCSRLITKLPSSSCSCNLFFCQSAHHTSFPTSPSLTSDIPMYWDLPEVLTTSVIKPVHFYSSLFLLLFLPGTVLILFPDNLPTLLIPRYPQTNLRTRVHFQNSQVSRDSFQETLPAHQHPFPVLTVALGAWWRCETLAFPHVDEQLRFGRFDLRQDRKETFFRFGHVK